MLKPTVSINLRMPKHVHRKMVADAKRHGVSLNTEILSRLDAHSAQVEELRPYFMKLVEQIRGAKNAQG